MKYNFSGNYKVLFGSAEGKRGRNLISVRLREGHKDHILRPYVMHKL